MVSKHFLPSAADLPQLVTAAGNVIPYPQLVAIDIDNITAEYESHAAWQATIGFATARRVADAATRKRELKRIEAKKFFEIRDTIAKSGAKATNDAITAAVTLDPEVQAAEDTYDLAEERAAIMEAALRAFIARKDMLVNLGAHERAEIPRTLRREDN